MKRILTVFVMLGACLAVTSAQQPAAQVTYLDAETFAALTAKGGAFTASLDHRPAGHERGPLSWESAPGAGGGLGPTAVFTALQDHLGLKLEPHTTPLEVLVATGPGPRQLKRTWSA